MAAERVRVLSAVVEDHPGVLNRVTGLIRRRGFNIQGLSVGRTEQPGRSRMTLTVDAGHAEVDQVHKQLDRLIEVIEVRDITTQPRFTRELVVARVARAGISDLVARGARLLADGPQAVSLEYSGESEDVARFIDYLRPLGILELARSGPVAMPRSE